MAQGRERRPAEDQAATVLADERNASKVRPCWPSWRQATRPPDIRATYPDPATHYARTEPYGLTVDELRAEWRRQAVTWARWELEVRLLPAAVSQ